MHTTCTTSVISVIITIYKHRLHYNSIYCCAYYRSLLYTSHYIVYLIIILLYTSRFAFHYLFSGTFRADNFQSEFFPVSSYIYIYIRYLTISRTGKAEFHLYILLTRSECHRLSCSPPHLYTHPDDVNAMFFHFALYCSAAYITTHTHTNAHIIQ